MIETSIKQNKAKTPIYCSRNTISIMRSNALTTHPASQQGSHSLQSPCVSDLKTSQLQEGRTVSLSSQVQMLNSVSDSTFLRRVLT